MRLLSPQDFELPPGEDLNMKVHFAVLLTLLLLLVHRNNLR
jgi:hypothetical protein